MAKTVPKLEEGFCTCPGCGDILTACVYNPQTLQLAVTCYRCGHISVVVKQR
jgi:transcription elongation factor Elf1